MEGIKRSVWEYAKDSKLNEIVENSKKYAENDGKGLTDLTTNESQLVLTRSSSSCGIFFVVGYTLKRRVRRWASRLLKWLKDDYSSVQET